jgi:predicted permease
MDAELAEELTFHREMKQRELEDAGMTVADAEYASKSALGNMTLAREKAREVWMWRWVDDLWRDLAYAIRGLTKNFGFSAVAIVMLALGIGATTAIFSVVNGVLIKPLPYPNADALVRIVHNIGGIEQQFFSDAIYLHYVENTQAFEDLGVWSPGATATITGGGDPEEVRALWASRGVLTTLGVRPEIGRWFSPDEDTPGARDTVIVTSGYWRRRLGGDPAVLERSLTINGRPHQIVGVMSADFRFSRDFDIVLPLRINTASPGGIFRLVGVARLKPGITLAQASVDVNRILDIWFSGPRANPAVRARWTPSLLPLKEDVVGNVGSTLWILMGAIAIVLLMACANVANLLLARANVRRQELAIRAALGASVARIARQLLVESLMLASLGGVLGIALAYGGLRALVALGPANLPRLAEIAIDPVVLGFAVTISVASGLLFGLIPVLKHARPRLAQALAAGRHANPTLERQRSQQALVAAQMALALVLLISAGLMIRSFHALRTIDHGFTRPEHVQTFSISIPGDHSPERVTRMQQDVLEKLAAIPGVAASAFTTRVPMGRTRNSSALLPEGDQVDDRRTPPNRHVKVVSPGTFRVLGTRLVAGRDFTWTDLYDRRTVAIVSENLSREMWGTPSAALGKRFREYYDAQGPWWEVVGVAGDVHDDGADRPAPASVYWPAQPLQRIFGIPGFQARRVTVVVRSERANTESLLSQVREAVWSVSPMLPLAQVSTLDEVYGQSMARTSFTLVMLAIAGAMALLLGIFGLFGVISYAVSQRRREIGIRLALGAQAPEILGLFMRQGLVLAGVGVAIGLGAAAGFTTLMRSLVFGISPFDPITFTAMPLVLVAMAVLAAYFPARRATKVDPMVALRCE